MTTLVNERAGSEAPKADFKALLERLFKAFGPASARERSPQEDRALRRELWMLGGG